MLCPQKQSSVSRQSECEYKHPSGQLWQTSRLVESATSFTWESVSRGNAVLLGVRSNSERNIIQAKRDRIACFRAGTQLLPDEFHGGIHAGVALKREREKGRILCLFSSFLHSLLEPKPHKESDREYMSQLSLLYIFCAGFRLSVPPTGVPTASATYAASSEPMKEKMDINKFSYQIFSCLCWFS